jgi:cell wall-associated NlpC family hydrolase
MTLPSTAARPARLTAVLAAAATLLTMLVAALTIATPARAANPAGPHDPIGAVEKITADSDGGYTVTGWAADPDNLTADTRVVNLVDGQRKLSVLTSIARPKITNEYHTGATPGFSLKVSPRSGVHTVCIAAYNTAAGLPSVLKCFVTPRSASISQSRYDPQGALGSTTASSSTMTVVGHATDPDFLVRRLTVVLYVDGSAAKTVTTQWVHNPDGSQTNQFAITVPVSTGSHLGCVWVVNVGFGSNSFLGCHAADTRGAPGTGTVQEPKVNKTVVTVAKQQIGKPYVWAAAGPRSFDCSGLVVFSYGKAGRTGIYHQSQVQFNDARLIPASRALPGDLVFYHDSEGSVYHVGIYLSPGRTVAAIDPSEGVNYQTIWDPSSATYGSFTHR